MSANRFYITERETGSVVSGPHSLRIARTLAEPHHKIRTTDQIKIIRKRGAPAGNQNARKHAEHARVNYSGDAADVARIAEIGDDSFSAGVNRLLAFYEEHKPGR